MKIQVPVITTNWLKEVYGFIKNEYYEIYFNGVYFNPTNFSKKYELSHKCTNLSDNSYFKVPSGLS